MTIKNSALILAALALAGCAAIRARNCTEKAGYQRGLEDAGAGRALSVQSHTLVCDKESRPLVEKGYRAGYAAGQSGGGSALNVTLKGGKLALAGAYTCTAAYKLQNFRGEGTTEAEARAKALEKCRAKHQSCGDMDVTCAKN